MGGYYLPAGGTVSYLTDRAGGDVYFNSGPNLLTFMITTAADLALTLLGAKENADPVVAGKADAAATALSAGDLVSIGKCLADTAAADPPASVTDAVRLGLGCLEELAKGALKDVLLSPVALLQTLVGPIAAAYDIGQDAAAGADAQAVLVRGAAPCPSVADFLAVPGTAAGATVHDDVVCHDHLATTEVYAGAAPPEPPHYVLRSQSGSWKLFTTVVDGYPSDPAQCGALPVWIKQGLFMNCP